MPSNDVCPNVYNYIFKKYALSSQTKNDYGFVLNENLHTLKTMQTAWITQGAVHTVAWLLSVTLANYVDERIMYLLLIVVINAMLFKSKWATIKKQYEQINEFKHGLGTMTLLVLSISFVAVDLVVDSGRSLLTGFGCLLQASINHDVQHLLTCPMVTVGEFLSRGNYVYLSSVAGSLLVAYEPPKVAPEKSVRGWLRPIIIYNEMPKDSGKDENPLPRTRPTRTKRTPSRTRSKTPVRTLRSATPRRIKKTG